MVVILVVGSGGDGGDDLVVVFLVVVVEGCGEGLAAVKRVGYGGNLFPAKQYKGSKRPLKEGGFRVRTQSQGFSRGLHEEPAGPSPTSGVSR